MPMGKINTICAPVDAEGVYDLDALQCVSASAAGPFLRSYYNDVAQSCMCTDSEELFASARQFRSFSAWATPSAAKEHRRAGPRSAPMLIGLLGLLNPAGCGGRVPGDERSKWLPAALISPQGLGDAIAYAGTDQEIGFGFLPNGYFGRPTDIPSATSTELDDLIGMIFDQLSETTLNFAHPDLNSTIANNIYLTMTDLNTWPNAYYAKEMARAYGFQVLDAQMNIISDCWNDSCRFQDVIVIKNRNLHPTSRDRSALSDGERAELNKMAAWMSEELSHDFLETADGNSRDAFLQKIQGLWSAGSSGMADDIVFSNAWFTGGIPYAITDAGIKNYSLRSFLQSAILETHPGASASEQFDMEIALISWLQLICGYAASFIGNPGQSYFDLYKQNDAAKGVSIGTYEEYRNRFIERESFPHLVGSSPTRQAYPALLRQSLDGPFLTEYLDQRFSDGFASDPRIANNPYLSDLDSLQALVSEVIPLMLAKETGQL